MSSMTGTRERDRDTYHRMKFEECRHIIKIDKEKDVLKDRKGGIRSREMSLFYTAFHCREKDAG